MATGQRHVDKLLAKVEKLAVRPEETERFRAGIERAKKMAADLGRFKRRVDYSCAWLGSAGSSIESLRSAEGFQRLIKLRDERLAKNPRVEYIDGRKYVWAPGAVADQCNATML